jgi:catechol 2,3-dioxygenase-like lactoylglutathione lyase family enzyme
VARARPVAVGDNEKVLGHLGLNVPDLDAAKAYYDQLMPLLEFEEFITASDEFAYRPAQGKGGTFVFFYPAAESGHYSRHQAGLQHLAFMVPTRTAVHAVHHKILQLSGQVLYPPQEFPQYPPPYFATFWLDPFGIMLEAVCHHDRP